MAKDKPQIVVRRRRKLRRVDAPLPSEGFEHRRQGRFTLVVPRSDARWDARNRIFRSLVYDRDGRVVSVGLPKFFEPHEREADRLAAAEELARGEGWLTVKHGGVLVIRSVIRGRVVFRTRGSFDGEHHGRAIEQIAREHYPALCDPEWMAGHSVHMEYVSPLPPHRRPLPGA